jgi:hypothetical protein
MAGIEHTWEDVRQGIADPPLVGFADAEIVIEPANKYAFHEQQLVRPDGTVLVSILRAPGTKVMFIPEPGFDIVGACYGRVRELPDGQWLVIAYFPQGWPGPAEPPPQEVLDAGRGQGTQADRTGLERR